MFASNAAAYYTSHPLFKVVTTSGTTTTTAFYGGQVLTSTYATDLTAYTTASSSANKYNAAGSTNAQSFGSDTAAIVASGSAFKAPYTGGVTTTVLQSLMEMIFGLTNPVPAGSTFSNASLWTKYGTDTNNGTWYKLDPTQLAAVITNGFATLFVTGNYYFSYCS